MKMATANPPRPRKMKKPRNNCERIEAFGILTNLTNTARPILLRLEATLRNWRTPHSVRHPCLTWSRASLPGGSAWPAFDTCKQQADLRPLFRLPLPKPPHFYEALNKTRMRHSFSHPCQAAGKPPSTSGRDA
jgi:hypothetical protein